MSKYISLNLKQNALRGPDIFSPFFLANQIIRQAISRRHGIRLKDAVNFPVV